ncbi:MAG: hypothetical protein AB1816_10325 [Bacillota bacterium]
MRCVADLAAEVLDFVSRCPVVTRWHVRELWGSDGVSVLESLERSGKLVRPPCLAPNGEEVESGRYFVKRGVKLPPARVPALSLLGCAVVEAARSGLGIRLVPASWRGFAPVGVLEYEGRRCGVWVLPPWRSLASDDAGAVAAFLEKRGQECHLWAFLVEKPWWGSARSLLLDRRVRVPLWVLPHSGSGWFLYDLLVFPQRRGWWMARVLSRFYGAEVKAEEDPSVVGGVVGVLPGGRRVVLVDGVYDVSLPSRLRLLHDPRGRARGVYVHSGDPGWGRLLLEQLGFPPWARVLAEGCVCAFRDGNLVKLGGEAA